MFGQKKISIILTPDIASSSWANDDSVAEIQIETPLHDESEKWMEDFKENTNDSKDHESGSNLKDSKDDILKMIRVEWKVNSKRRSRKRLKVLSNGNAITRALGNQVSTPCLLL